MNTTVVSGYTLTTKGKYSSTISWTVDQDHSEILFNNQLINETDEDIEITLTAKVSYNTFTSGNVDFEITVLYEKETDAEEYYSSISNTVGTALKYELRELITETHIKTTTYDELKEYLQEADEDPNNSNNMILFYTGASVPKTSNMKIWNREHVWAQSLSNGWFGTSGAGADMHHIRPCNPGENSSRGNKKFGTSSGYYDPSKHGDDYRGDVARIIFYMFVRYTEADKHTFKSVAQSKELLLEWNKIDPVSETEIIRNDYTYTIQGNRNPFIDHPECADLIWGETNLLNNQVYEEYKMVIVAYIDEKKINEWV